jgi:hypothetical protein
VTVLIAVLVVGAGSLFLRTAPLPGARHLPDRLTEAAGWAGIAVVAITVRAVLHHHDSGTPAAPLGAAVAAVAVATGLLLAFRGREGEGARKATTTTFPTTRAPDRPVLQPKE